MVAEEARRQDRQIKALFIDLEAQYDATINHVEEARETYSDVVDLDWVALPLSLRNAVSNYQPQWLCWDPEAETDWVRKPPKHAITDVDHWDWFETGMEFEDFVVEYAKHQGRDVTTIQHVGIRTQESLNRWRTITRSNKAKFLDLPYTTYVAKHTYNAYPIYDWKTRDVWIHAAKENVRHNRIYELMTKAGVPLHNQRICQPYGDDQRRGLWLYQVLEPDTWPKVVARVNGANSGALYAQERGNINGTVKVTLPPGHTWESFSKLLLDTLPTDTREHYAIKIDTFISWWRERGYEDGIPDEADPELENTKKAPSWRRIAKTLLRNDYWCKGLSFTQHKSEAYERYRRMKEDRKRWV